MTFPAQATEPHLHLDNRALMVYDGSRTLRLASSSFRWISETLQVIAAEGRASRASGQLFVGGFTGADGRRTLYFGLRDDVVTVSVERDVFDALARGLGQSHPRT